MQKSFKRLFTVATYCLGSHGCHPCPHGVCFRLCCCSDGCRSCRSGGDSCPGRVAGGGRSLAPPCSADFCRRCASGTAAVDTGCYYVASSPLCQNFHLRTAASAEARRSRHSTAQAAASGAATSRCSSTDDVRDRQQDDWSQKSCRFSHFNYAGYTFLNLCHRIRRYI